MRISFAAWGLVGRRGWDLEAWWRDMAKNLGGRLDMNKSRGGLMQRSKSTSVMVSLLDKYGLFRVVWLGVEESEVLRCMG